MRLLPLVLACILLGAGCIGANAGTKTTIPGPGGFKKLYDNSTLEGALQNTPHVNILGPATLVFSLPNGTADKPQVLSYLVYIGNRAKSGLHDLTGTVELAAFVPVEATLGACQKLPSDARAYFRMRDVSTGNNNNNKKWGNLSGEYAPGWYHVVVVGITAADFTISFDTEKGLTPRKLPAQDPYAGGGGFSTSGAKDQSKSVSPAGAWWYAWAGHQLAQNNPDGGHTHSVSIGDCQSTKTTSTAPTGAQDRTNIVTAAGTQTAFEIKGGSVPTLAAAAATTSVLDGGWVWVKPVPLQAAASPGAS